MGVLGPVSEEPSLCGHAFLLLKSCSNVPIPTWGFWENDKAQVSSVTENLPWALGLPLVSTHLTLCTEATRGSEEDFPGAEVCVSVPS